MPIIQHIGNGHPPGLRLGTSRAWTSGECRDVPGSTAADLLERHPSKFQRVASMDRAMRSPSATPELPAGVAGRHWKTLAAEVRRGEHDQHLAPLAEATESKAVAAAIRERSQALRAS